MKKKLLSLACMLLSVVSAMALTITPGKVYTIRNNNTSEKGECFLQDNGGTSVAVRALNDKSYWSFEDAGSGHYYVKNCVTGNYLQAYNVADNAVVSAGSEKAAYVVSFLSAQNYWGIALANQTVTNFSSGDCKGLNFNSGDMIAQAFKAQAGVNGKSFWVLAEAELPEPIVSPYPGNAVANGEEWYLYNVETGYWLGNNNHKWGDWTTRANANQVGLDWKIEAISGGWRLDPKFGHNNSMNSSNFYLDTNDAATAWTFTETPCEGATKAYKISANGKKLGVILGTNDKQELGYQLDFDGNTDGTWVLVTREQRLALASESNPVEASFLIPAYDMGDQNSRYKWNFSTNGSKDGPKVMWECNRVWETWNVTTMDAYTTCTNIPNGKYLVYSIGAYVPTGGSGMNGNDYDDYKANGSAAVHALAYANDKTAKMASVYSVENDHQENERWTKEVKTGVWVPDGWGSIANQCGHYGKYWSDPVEVIVTDGNLRVGVKMEEGAPGSSWVVFSGMRMQYLGEVDDPLTPALENLNAAITAALAIDQNKLTEAAKAALADAISAAQAQVKSTDVEAITAASSALNGIVENVRNMDITALKAAIDYMSGRDYNDATANNVLANGMTAAAVNDALGGLKVRFKQHVAEKSVQPTVFSMPSQSVVGTDDNVPATYVNDRKDGYYLYNVGTGRWFCGGDDWGAHAAVGFPGIKITTPEDNWNNGHYNGIVTFLFNGNWGDSGKLGNNGYCDTGGNAWKFWQKDASQGIYTISNNGNDQGVNTSNGFGTKDLVGFSADTYMRVDVHQADDNSLNNQWIFVTEAQRDQMAEAAKASATAENPVDLTWKIQMPGFNQRERVEGTNQGGDEAQETLPWTCNHENYTYDNVKYNYNDHGAHRHAICDRGGNHADFCVDIYGGGWNDAFSWTQTISNLAPGKYRVKVQGYNNNGEEANKAKLIAGNKSVVLREASSETQLPWVGRLADNTWEAVEYFQNGLYWNEVECVVGTDGKLTIGVESPNISGNHVVLFDNFRLEYIGENNDFAPETLKIRYNGKWDGEDMAVADDSNADVKHFHYEGWLGTNRNEGLFINFKSGDDFYCPSETNFEDQWVKLHVADANKEVTDLTNTGTNEAAGYAFTSKTNMVAVDVYFKYDGTTKVICTDKAADMAGDALYIAAEKKNNWSREPDKCYVLPKKSDGVYEGVITAIRENEYYDMARLFTKPNNGDNDNYIGFSGLVYAADSTYKLSYSPNGNFRIRKGEQKVTVDLNKGTVTFKYLGEPSYMYAVGTLVDHNWENNNHDAYKLVETEAGSLIFRGVVKVAEDGDSRFTLFEERTSTGWQEGRWLPGNEDSRNITKGEWRTNINRWADDAWRIPAGEYMVTMDVANQRLLCTDIHTQEVVVGEAGYATFVAKYPYAEKPTNTEIFAAQDKTTHVHLEAMTQIPAGEAVVIKAPKGTYTFTESAKATSEVENNLQSSTEDVEANGSHYILAKPADKVGFFQATSGTKIAAGKAFLVSTAGINALYFDEEETSIQALPEATGDKLQATEVYNLAGQRIQKMQRGVNIVNGKKVIF